jgi:hypothetical protein
VLAGCSRPPCRSDFSPRWQQNAFLFYSLLLGGRRLTHAVGLAAFSSTYSSSPPERSPLRAALVNVSTRHTTAHVISTRRPPPRSCQPPCVLHSRRVCFAVARLGASPLPARLTTAHSCRARPCLCAAKGVAQVCADRRRPPLPPRPTPAAADRPLAAIFHHTVCRPLVAAHTAVLVGRPAELLRWAGGFLGLLLQFGSSALAVSSSAQELSSPSRNRAHHLHSSARLLAPASHRVFFTRVAYASPSLGVALRHCLHGSARLILAVLCRERCDAKGGAADVCQPKERRPGRSAQPSLQPTALSGRFSTTSCADCRLALHLTTRRAAG